MAKEYQIKVNHGLGSYSCIYTTLPDDIEHYKLTSEVRRLVREDYEIECNSGMHFSTPEPPQRTVYVKEFKNGKALRDTEIKTKWR